MPLVHRTLTPAQLAANRRNAQKSTGPRTAQGKLRCSLNRLKYDRLSVKLTAMMIFWGEDVREYRKMHRDLIALFIPRTEDQSLCVTELAEAWWEKVRALRGYPDPRFRRDRVLESEEVIEEELENLMAAMCAERRKARYILEVRLGARFDSLAQLRNLVETRLEVVTEAERKFHKEIDAAGKDAPPYIGECLTQQPLENKGFAQNVRENEPIADIPR